MSEIDTVSILREAKQDLDFQLRFAKIAKTSNVMISKEQGYAILALIELFLKQTEKEKNVD